MGDIVLKMENSVKDFPGVRALDNVNFEARAGEVLVLAGENGAGKSTLMKILSGVWPYPSYQGDIYIKGQLRRFRGTKEAEEYGVAIIHQELNLIPGMSVAENIFLDRQFVNRFGVIDWDRMNSETRKLLDMLKIKDVSPTDLIKEHTVGKQQMIEIAKALSLEADILVFDEPTSALTETETEELFRIIRQLKDHGVCMIYISHKMDEFQQIADRVAVLRDGKTIGDSVPISEITMEEIIAKMVGRSIKDMFPKERFNRAEKVLEVKNFEVDHPYLEGEKKVKGVSFDAYKGEILGFSGLMGSGRTELVMGIFGATPGEARGDICINGKKVDIRSPLDAINNGISLVTEDRKLLGLILSQSVVSNITLSSLEKVSSKIGVINKLEETKVADKYVKELGIRAPNVEVRVDSLSGGNQQKVVIGKWLATDSAILILDEPTRGVDVGAKVEIYKLMNRLVDSGVTVIMISSELPEVMGMSDRILVMCEGELVANLKRAETNKEEIMGYATGSLIKKGEG